MMNVMASHLLTEIDRIVCERAIETYALCIRYDIGSFALVHALTFGQYVDVIEHFKYFRRRRVNRTNDSSATMSDAS